MQHLASKAVFAALILALLGAPAFAQSVKFEDPAGDDNGPGDYVYPTDAVYERGSFDLTSFELSIKGKRANAEVGINTTVKDPWNMGTGFSVQMIFVFIDQDGKEGSGFTTAPPGLNIEFAPDSAWEKCIIISPQASARLRDEINTKAGDMASAFVIPTRVRGSGSTISASLKVEDLGEGDPTTWGYQVVMQSNEGFPADGELLTRRVNEYEGQHRFGGGTDYDCDPHVMDILGDHSQLQYECKPDGTSVKKAVLSMVRK